MSKRKPALRIGGGVLNRNTLVSGTDSPKGLQTNGSVSSKTLPGENDIDAEVANFLKEIDEVEASEKTSAGDAEKKVKYGDWQQCVDEKTQHPYYWNTVTDEVTWVLPQEVLQHVSRQNQTVEEAPDKEKKVDEVKMTVSSDLSRPTSAELDIDAELEKAVEKKEEVSATSLTSCSEIINERESTKEEEKEVSKSNESSRDGDAGSEQLDSENGDETNKNTTTEIEDELTELSQTLFSKLQFLGISSAALTNFHFLLIQIQTRISDWREKALSTSFVLKKLQEADQQLKAYEKSATPSGWSCHWDSSAERYYYVNDRTQKKQWQYPEITSDDTESGILSENVHAEDDAAPAKKSRKVDASGESLPPLPATPQEKPPLPPQLPSVRNEVEGEGDSDNPDVDDGIMMEISDGEAENDVAKKSEKLAAAAVMSQQPVLYKGPTTKYRESSPGFENFPSTKTPVAAMSDEKLMSTKTKRKKVKKSSSVVKKPSKGMSSLVAQWQKAKNEIALEDRMLEEEEEEPNQEELAQHQIEKWKQQQITSGKAYSNANFEPVPEDWRSRLVHKKKKKA